MTEENEEAVRKRVLEVQILSPLLTRMSNVIYQSCEAAGWYTDLRTGQPIEKNVGEQIALMHTELSEAFEGWRKDSTDDHLPNRPSVEVELADAVIRILDFCGYHNLDIGGALAAKFAYNQHRPDHKIENRRAAGGKKV